VGSTLLQCGVKNHYLSNCLPPAGFEPAHLSAPVPKTGVSTIPPRRHSYSVTCSFFFVYHSLTTYAVFFYYFGYGRVVLILELIAHFIFQSLKAYSTYSKYSPTIVCCLGSPSKVATWSRPSRSPIAASDL
jgi:hypothetical protein